MVVKRTPPSASSLNQPTPLTSRHSLVGLSPGGANTPQRSVIGGAPPARAQSPGSVGRRVDCSTWSGRAASSSLQVARSAASGSGSVNETAPEQDEERTRAVSSAAVLTERRRRPGLKCEPQDR